MPWEIVVTNWKLTAEYRRKSIKSNRDWKLSEIYESWPILKHPNAHTLIEEDYSCLKLSTRELTLESWTTFFYKSFSCSATKKRRLMSFHQTDAKVAVQLRLLPHLLPPKNRFRVRKNQWKPSIPESKDSLVIFTVSIMIINIHRIQV